MPVSQLHASGVGVFAAGAGFEAARLKVAARSGVDRRGRLAGNRQAVPNLIRIDVRAMGDQHAGVWMARMRDNVVRLAVFHHAPQIHDSDMVGDIAGQRDIVADKDDGGVVLLRQIEQHVDDIRADGNIQHGDRLVSDDEVGLEEHAPDDGDSLKLSAGKLMRIALEDLLCRMQTAGFQRVAAHLQALFVTCADVVVFQRAHQDLFDRVPRGERIERILKDDLHALAESLVALLEHLRGRFTIQQYVAGGRVFQPDEHTPQRTLAAARFADDAQHFAAVHRQGNVVHSLDPAALLLALEKMDPAVVMRVPLGDMVNGQKRRVAHASFPPTR